MSNELITDGFELQEKYMCTYRYYRKKDKTWVVCCTDSGFIKAYTYIGKKSMDQIAVMVKEDTLHNLMADAKGRASE